ncbi:MULTISPECIES: LEA type 2 family protein [unclassified Oceanobacter]|jgi:LEA14-like dessication related protein|uniref:LEA type 2 family protein n=1 Tax=unclassified Oceanobacter TaxID=2620260 RepID=UPI0027325DD4|nr:MULTISPECIES: LEA type 2 family protein [unclassified Oceanobacter]MDP2504439.1 LEA type 2 family protein [Oceanobacter sp. 3_MG-2023]MDP2548335.1 LEA type 2 family protein [Oceanobacter sp. 4_MG-2023]MDP2608650.1 LEA type 2 family protein [Oceanobacter sp. 1_MG-2023]MDP2611746.1 LEA type 2 family protein [Oceanobacter sp. 2_MG-2023]
MNPILPTLTATGLILLSGCAALKESLTAADKPSATISGLSIQSLGLEQADLLVSLDVTNPNSFSIPASGLTMTMSVEDHALATVNQTDTDLTLSANETTTTQLPISFSYSDLYNAVKAVADQDEVTCQIDTALLFNLPVLGDISLPASYTTTLPIPQRPKISLASASVADLSWRGMELQLTVDVENPNGFGIDLKGLDYQVTAANSALASGSVQPANLEKNSQQQLVIPLSLSFADMASSLMSLLTSKEAVDIGVAGTLDYAPELAIWSPEPLDFSMSTALTR